jgi:adenosylcobinamide-GDP ribazoletransferase
MKKIPSLIAAFSFLTSIPLPGGKVSLEDAARGLWAFPFAGLFIGGLLYGLALLSSPFLSPLLLSGVLLCCWVWVTGGLHLDGYIDCCDALLASVSKERRLDILKDVATGSFGVTGAVILLLLKFSVLASIAPQFLPAVLLVSAVTGRTALLYVIFRFPYARQKGLGRIFKDTITIRDLLIAAFVLCASALGFLFFHCPVYTGFIMAAAALMWSELFGRWVLSRIPGLTGDVYGASCELAEVVSLVTGAVVLGVTR